MKKIIIILSILVILIMNINVIYAIEDGNIVKIRVRKPRQENEQVKIEAIKNFTVLNIQDDNEEMLFEFNEKKLNFRIDSYYDKSDDFKYYDDYSNEVNVGPFHLKLKNELYSTYDDATKKVEDLDDENIKSYVYFNGQKYEIWMGAFVNHDGANDKKKKLSKKDIKTEIIYDDFDRIIVYDDSDNIMFAYKNNYDIFFSSFDSELDMRSVLIDGKKYRGIIGFYIIEDYKLVTVNRLDIESYLYGVVPNEISPSWFEEAIKAQAIAARTYAVSHISSNTNYGYHMVDNQNNQVYGGYESEYENSNKAVDDTAGKMIYYDDNLINAYFHSTSGGKTENSENVWTYSLPYAKGVDDEYSNISPYTTWIKDADQQYIIDNLVEDGYDVNKIYDIRITKKSENNRALEVLIETDNEEIFFEKESIRRVLGYSFLLSTWFDVESNNKKAFISVNKDNTEQVTENLEDTKVIVKDDYYDNLYGKNMISAKGIYQIDSEAVSCIGNKSIEETTTYPYEFYFDGRGWGHGIGMSQYGAKQMAIEGFTHEEILKHYYYGVEIK